MFDHPQVEAMGLMRPYHSKQAGNYLGLAQWAHFGASGQARASEGKTTEEVTENATGSAKDRANDSANGRAAPSLGEHSEKILSTLGYTAQEIEQLMQSAVVQ
ncbi:Formyl-CoA:oxalate CoA-transferase [compost metagenome]